MRIGIGYDSHRLSKNRRLIIGGVEIPFDRGLEGHSDADVLCHAIIDAILGALGDGDIGSHFPDDNPEWKDQSSIKMLSIITGMTREAGFEIEWIDSIIHAEQPKMRPHIESMKDALAGSGIRRDRISIKAKTGEGMGDIGRGEGIAAQAVCLLRPL
jgi:2-C-methyl-D-erythritol 2,4-cyclodiphosphate synthase